MEPEVKPAGTPEPKPAVSGDAGTGAGAPEGSAAQDGPPDYKTMYEREHAERLANLGKTEEANRILEQSRQAQREAPTTRSAEALSPMDLTAAEIQHVEQLAAAGDVGAKAILLTLNAANRALMDSEIAGYPADQQPALREAVRHTQHRVPVSTVAAHLASQRLPTLQEENEALKRKLAEVTAGKAPEPGTHMRTAPASAGGAPSSVTGAQMTALYTPGSPDFNPQRGRELDKLIDQGKVEYLP